MVKLKSFRNIEPESLVPPALESSSIAPSSGRSSINSLPSNEEYQLEQINLQEEGEDEEAEPENASFEEEELEIEEEEQTESDVPHQGEEGASRQSPLRHARGGYSASLGMGTLQQHQNNRHYNRHQKFKFNKSLRGSLTSQQSTNNNQQQQSANQTPSLAALRHQFLAELASVGSPKSGRGGPVPCPSSLSPIISRALDLKEGDSVSQQRLQLNNLPTNNQFQNGTSNNCFEIRWRQINLYAKKTQSLSESLGERFRQMVWGSARKNKLFHAGGLPPSASLPMTPVIFGTPLVGSRMSDSAGVVSSLYADQQQQQVMVGNGGGIKSTIGKYTSSLGANLTDSSVLDYEPFLTNPKNYRQILQNVSGSVYSGQLTAILGPSGVGKSTLLNTLTGRNQLAGVGRVSLLGCSERRVSVVFVPQWDVLPELLTTLEDLQFTSQLKNPHQSAQEHERNINRIVKLLQLDKFLHVRIKNLSGGQARRLSIGRELLGSPDIMILDEPTSGLDANTCKKIIQALRDLTEQSDNLLERPMSIIVTIHQPQQEVYELFHRVYVMALGGRAIYEGPPGQLMSSFLENSALAKIIPPEQLNENPAVVALEVASGEYGEALIDDLDRYHQSQTENYSPFSTPSVFLRTPKLRSPKPIVLRSPLPSPINSLNNGNATSRTPKVAPRMSLKNSQATRANATITAPNQPNSEQQMQMQTQWQNWDKMSAVTSISYASTYDADLPEPIAPKLKVDKRLRRSVVVQGDFVRQTWTLMRRSWRMATRDVFLMCVRIIGFIGVAGGAIQIFSETLDINDHQCPQFVSQVDDLQGYMTDTRTRLQGLQKFLTQSFSARMYFFHLITTILMITAALTGLVFPTQLRMFLREYKNGWYSPASFITSITLSELLVDMLGPVIMVTTTYQLCQQPESMYHWREGAYLLLMMLCALNIKGQSQMISTFFRNSIENSVFMSCVMVVLPIFTSGLPVAINNLPSYLHLASFVSYGRWTYEGLNLVRYGYDRCPCDQETVNGFPVSINENAVPARLHTFSSQLLNYYTDQSTNQSLATMTTTLAPPLVSNDNSIILLAQQQNSATTQEDSLFGQFVKLASHAANPLIETHEELGDCSTYRSLALIQMGIPDRILPQIFLILGLTFIVFRILTYFCVKAVIKFNPAPN